MSRVIGYVKAVENGTFFVKDAKGKVHQLKVGEAIHEGELVYGAQSNPNNAKITVDVTLQGAGDLVIAGNGALHFDTSLLAGVFSHHDAVVYVNSVHDALAAMPSKESLAAAATDAGDTNAGETAAGDAVTDTERASDTFADRTGAVGDVTTQLDNGPTAGDQTSPLIAATDVQTVNSQPIVSDVSAAATESDGLETIFTGILEVTDPDTANTHTFQQTGAAAVITSSGAVVSDLAVAVAADGTYTV
ncbi:hypothetical protein, partial [Sulfuricurvum sp.]|uniref:hypothetical protein n=1 Tax=Sulfuricurvum sp. TaxID=2025608 RepID=UPI003BAEB7B5